MCTRARSTSVTLTIGLLLVALRATWAAVRAAALLLLVELAQGAVGFAQYFTGPARRRWLPPTCSVRPSRSARWRGRVRRAVDQRSASEQRVERDGHEQQRRGRGWSSGTAASA